MAETEDDGVVGRRVSVYWPEEEEWFEGEITERGNSPSQNRGVYNNVGWKVEYDDGDIGWITEVADEAKVRFLDGAGQPSTNSPPRPGASPLTARRAPGKGAAPPWGSAPQTC